MRGKPREVSLFGTRKGEGRHAKPSSPILSMFSYNFYCLKDYSRHNSSTKLPNVKDQG